MDLVKSMNFSVDLNSLDALMHVSIHEDNAVKLVVAKTLPPQFRRRSKWYFTIKTIWIREEIQKRGLCLLSIPNKMQLEDASNKSLSTVMFEFLRGKPIDW